MDWQNDEFEELLRKFRLRESRPLTLLQPPNTRRYRLKIAAAAALVLAIGASAAIVRQLSVKKAAPVLVETVKEVPQPAALETPTAVASAATSAPIPPLPQLKAPSLKPDPKLPEPLEQLTVVVPAPPQDTGPSSKQDSPQPAGAEEAAQAYRKALEDQGRQIVNNACGLCHSPDLTGNSHFGTSDEYAAIVNRMVGMGAPVSPQQVPLVVDYLFKTYGRKPESAAADPGNAVFNMACGQCHSTDLVEGRKGVDKDTYRSIVNNMIGYGASVAPDQIDSLVDYLFRTYGKKLN